MFLPDQNEPRRRPDIDRLDRLITLFVSVAVTLLVCLFVEDAPNPVTILVALVILCVGWLPFFSSLKGSK